MKISKIKECLEGYDANKGFSRRNLKGEPHIEELRQFYDPIKEENRDLTPEEHLKLVKICLGKNTWNDSESSKALDGLLDQLGGREALQRLKDHKRLTMTTVVLIETNKQFADELSHFIVLLKGVVTGEPLRTLIKQIDLSTIQPKLKDIRSLKKANLLCQETVLLVAKCEAEAATAMANTILLLDKHKIGKEAWDYLPCSIYIGSIYNILLRLESTDPNLIAPHLKAICNLEKDSLLLSEILDELSQIKGFIFRETGWNTEYNLDAIIVSIIAGFGTKIAIAFEKLKTFKLSPHLVQPILETIFKFPECYDKFLDGVGNLLQNDLMDKDNLGVICRTPGYADDLAFLLKELKDGQYSPETKELALRDPENATIVGSIMVYLDLKLFNAEDELLQTNAKLTKKNILCQELLSKKLMRVELLDLLADLESAELLNLPNIEKLIKHAQFFRVVESACTCLFDSDKLDQRNFDLLFEDPEHALSIVEVLGAKPHPVTTSEEKYTNKGAKDFVRIREVARVFAQGHAQHSFFRLPSEPLAQKIKVFCKLSKQDPSQFEPAVQLEVQKQILTKIVQMCGNGYLKKEVEQAIASDFFARPS
ncbi:Uncharacterised protein [Legionella lansingensis]|uniref:Uncharacterized protein n=1 Tax=Legionella lansingensis TaxID=45067 RepID=A0A0W0W005_9GAMM|nr:hypothetical protein [Legionella lansingensis]KTD25723.1 hypothetical protein Llan_0113 [Legionella lansingensis]SNV49265.1 Uncharacterised protein [Legionella lansingensis]